VNPASGSIVWLASYPKSGNTWLRAMLTALLNRDAKVPDINNLVGASELIERQTLDDVTGISSAEFTQRELLPYLRAMRQAANGGNLTPTFLKVHDRFEYTATGEAVFPPDVTRLAVYIVRNPLDIAHSFAAHSSWSIDATIAHMARNDALLDDRAGRGNEFVPVRLGSWSDHVGGWLDQKVLPLLLLRYEDMLADPGAALASVARGCGIACSEQDIADAVDACRFERLQAAEESARFRERPAGVTSFFRAGLANAWHQHLTARQVTAVIKCHADRMRLLGYSA
jgi:aryl sulfotransferase